MKRWKIIAAITLTGALFLSGCGKTGQTTETSVQKGKLFEETFEFSIMMSYVSSQQETDPYLETYIQDLLNCKINYIKAPQASWQEKLNITLASANLPDLIYMTPQPASKWIAQDALLPLGDLMKKYGGDMLKTYTPQDLAAMSDIDTGDIYCLRGINEISEIYSLGIRQDWLDKLGLKEPDTIDEWRAVLTAFKNNPGALGKSTVVPWVGTLVPFYNAFGIMSFGSSAGYNELYTLDDGGNYMLKYDHPNYRKALETIRSFYQDGLIDREYIARKDSASIYEMLNNGTAGAGQVYASRLREITEILQKTDEKALMKNILPIQNPGGKRMIPGRDRFASGACISVTAGKSGKAENIMKFLNFLFTDEGKRLYNFGVKGRHYNMVDGKPTLLAPYNNGWIELRKEGINPTGQIFVWDVDAYKQSLLNGKTLEEADQLERLVYDGLYSNSEYCFAPLVTFVTPTIAERGTDIFGSLSEMESKTIMGAMTVDAFFTEYEKLRADGLDEIRKEITEYWGKYQSYIKKN